MRRIDFVLNRESAPHSEVQANGEITNKGYFVESTPVIPFNPVIPFDLTLEGIFNNFLSWNYDTFLNLWRHDQLTNITVLVLVQREIAQYPVNFSDSNICNYFINCASTYFESTEDQL